MLDDNNNQDKAMLSSWKITTVVAIIVAVIMGLILLPAAMAGNEEFVHLPVILSPPIPGSTGVLAFTVSSGAEREIYTMNANGSGRTQLTDNNAVDDMPAWSADGATLAFTSDRRQAEYYEIYTMNADGSGVERLTNSVDADNPRDDNSPSFSPKGDKIVFASDRSDLFQVFVMNSDGSEQTALTEDSYFSGSPEWSPDGTKIVYASNQDDTFLDIYIMDADGSHKEKITESDGHDFSPAWSPDGKQIVFTSLRDGRRRIYVMKVDGSGQKKLVTFYSDWADWSPDGTRIVFTRLEGNSTALSSSQADLAPDAARHFLAHRADAEDEDKNLYTIRPDGSDLQPLTQTADTSEDRANWGP